MRQTPRSRKLKTVCCDLLFLIFNCQNADESSLAAESEAADDGDPASPADDAADESLDSLGLGSEDLASLRKPSAQDAVAGSAKLQKLDRQIQATPACCASDLTQFLHSRSDSNRRCKGVLQTTLLQNCSDIHTNQSLHVLPAANF
jgi:hypothetical protein